MARRPLCADNLFLLGELLQDAIAYLNRCQATYHQEERQMVELAREQIPQIRQMMEAIERELQELEGCLNKKATWSNREKARGEASNAQIGKAPSESLGD
jgi:hypothetical protein